MANGPRKWCMSLWVAVMMVASTFLLPSLSAAPCSGPPAVTGTPVVLGENDLIFPRENGTGFLPNLEQRAFGYPDLTGRANRLDDFHGVVQGGDLVISTAGNFHVFLNYFMRQVYLPANPLVKQYWYTTSPPVSIPQVSNGGRVSVGNMEFLGDPHVIMGPAGIMNQVVANLWNDGPAVKFLSNYANVIIVPASNPLGITSVSDLRDVRLVTSHNLMERGSFGNYASSIWHVKFWEERVENGKSFSLACNSADQLFDQIFNDNHDQKWRVGSRIMHRDTPGAVASGEADAGMLFWHLAQTAMFQRPGVFEIIPIGTLAQIPDPNNPGSTMTVQEPKTGNRVATMQAIKLDANQFGFGAQEVINRDRFMTAISDTVANANLLAQGWVRPPVTTGNNQPTPE